MIKESDIYRQNAGNCLRFLGGINIHKPSGELVGPLANADKATDKHFPPADLLNFQ